MAVFANKQVAHIYVAKSFDATITKFDELNEVGKMGIKAIPALDAVKIMHRGKKNHAVASDAIKNVKRIMIKKAADELTTSKAYVVTLAEASDIAKNTAAVGTVKGGAITARIEFTGLISGSDDTKYWKHSGVQSTGVVASTVEELAKNLAMSFDREAMTELAPNGQKVSQLVLVGFAQAAGKVVLFDTKGNAVEANVSIDGIEKNSLVVIERQQDWIKGTANDHLPAIDLVVNGVDNVEVACKTVKLPSGLTLAGRSCDHTNAHKCADMEYFYMGNRGDQFRLANWPNYVPTDMFLDGSEACDVISVEYAFIGDGVEFGTKSDKQVIIMVPASATEGTAQAIAKTLCSYFPSAITNYKEA